MITNELNRFEKHLLSTIKKELNDQYKFLLDGLLDPVSNPSGGPTEETDLYLRPRVTLMKNISQSTRPAKIKPEFATNSLRHTCANLALDGGSPIDQFQEMLRQSEIETTMIYLRQWNRVEKAAEKHISQI